MNKITRSAARHIFFSISMIGRYRTEGRRKWYLFYALCDESYAMLSRDVSVLEEKCDIQRCDRNSFIYVFGAKRILKMIDW